MRFFLILFLLVVIATPSLGEPLNESSLQVWKVGNRRWTVEEEALFPALRKKGKNAETLVDELLLQHRSIMEKYSNIAQASHTDEEKREILLELAQELAEHGRKEEISVPPIVTQMSLEQLREIDQAAKRLGYPV